MEFRADWRVYNTRYGMGLVSFLGMCAWMLFYPLALGKGLMFVELFTKAFFFDKRITALSLVILLYCHIICYFASGSSTKLLTILEDKLVIITFNGKTLELNYSDIKSLNYTANMFKNFEFTLKTGEKKIVYAGLKNQQQAFDLIRQKIIEANS